MTLIFLNTFVLPCLIALSISVTLFLVGLKMLRKKMSTTSQSTDCAQQEHTFLEVESIAGDDIWSTKLDLARAYLETGQASLAKSVILEVASCADIMLQHEANVLLNTHFGTASVDSVKSEGHG